MIIEYDIYLRLYSYSLRLGVATRAKCEETLTRTGWSLQIAAAVLLESQS